MIVSLLSRITLCPVCGAVSYSPSYLLDHVNDCDECTLWYALVMAGGVS